MGSGCLCSQEQVVSPVVRRYSAKTAKTFTNPFNQLPSPLQRPALYPPELLLQSVPDSKKQELISDARDHPKTVDADLFTQLCVHQLHDAEKMKHADLVKLSSVADDCFPQRKLDKIKKLGYILPDFHEEPHSLGTVGGKLLKQADVRLLEFVLDDSLPLYDDVEAVFFDSQEEAALYFDVVLRPLLDFDATSRTVTDGRVCRRKHVHGDVSAMAFTGLGQWWLRTVHGTGQDADWPDRQAPRDCMPPTGTIAVIDMCKMADFEVRKGFLPYGAAAFFGAHHEVLAVFIPEPKKIDEEHSGEMFSPLGIEMNEAKRDAWEFALWRFKSTLYWLSFGVFHLVHCHWITSNSLVIATREELPPSHRVRQLVWPFLHNSVTINATAAVKLASKQGALVRVSSNTLDAAVEMIEWLTTIWRYETFEEQLANTQLPETMLSELPMVQDGRRLWQIISTFVRNYLAVFYHPEDASSDRDGARERMRAVDDEILLSFWESADTAAIQARRLGLPQPLSFGALADYLAHAIFTLTGVHEMIGHILVDMTLPTTTGSRIREPHLFGANAGGRLPQSTLQDYFRMLGIAASVSIWPMPMFGPEMKRAAHVWAGNQNEPEALRQQVSTIYSDFANELEMLSDELDKVNCARDAPFGLFNPRILECSVGL